MFGLFRKRKQAVATPAPADETPAPAPGWDAIEEAFEHLYPGQVLRLWEHHGVHRMHDLANPPANPLEAVRIYDGGTFWHYVSFGLSDLYRKESADDWSGFGYELTFRVAKTVGEENPPLWPVSVMVSLASARYTAQDYASGDTVKTGPLDGRPECRLTALLIFEDPAFKVLETPFGKLVFLQLVGVEAETRERALRIGSQRVIDELRFSNPDLITRVTT
jgi:suppressor of fused